MQLVFLIVLPGLAATTAGRLKLDVDIPHAREDAEAAAERPEGQRASSDGDCEEPCQETSFLDAGAAVSREDAAIPTYAPRTASGAGRPQYSFRAGLNQMKGSGATARTAR
jgi:hypothetical protein